MSGTRSSQPLSYHVNVGREIPRCLVCNEPLSNIGYIDGWCIACAGASLAAELRLRDGPPEVVALRVAALRDWGAEHIARAIIGPLPFTPVVGE